jgi:hypothetical protein
MAAELEQLLTRHLDALELRRLARPNTAPLRLSSMATMRDGLF